MNKSQEKSSEFKIADSNTAYFLGVVVVLISLVIRVISFPVETDDYIFFLSNWFETLDQNPGLSAFETTFANYTPIYLYLLKILTLIPLPSLYSIKTLSVIFDILLALTATLIIRKAFERKISRAQSFFVFSVFFSIPTVILNSSLWAQSDSIYSAGILSSFYFLIAGLPLLSIIFFSLAFSIKAQSVFFLPALMLFLVKFKKWKTLIYLLAIPAVYTVSILPAWLGGGPLHDLLFVYFRQTQEYSELSLNAPNIYAFINESAIAETTKNILFSGGLILAGIASVTIACIIAKTRNIEIKEMVFLSLLTVLVMPYLLPGMHERFFFLADIFSVIYALLEPKRWYIPALVISSSFFSYMPFLSQSVPFLEYLEIGIRIPSAIILFAISIMIYILFKKRISL